MGNAIIARTFKNKDIPIVQETGTSETDVMSQKAVTDKLTELETTIETLNNKVTTLETTIGTLNNSLEAVLNGN